MKAILFLALLLRLVRLNDSFWLDEAAQILESARPLSQQLQIAADFQPPLMHLLTFFWLRLLSVFGLGQNEALLRLLPSVIPGLISVWATYQIALQLFAKKKQARAIAFLSALFLATSPLHIFFSQELRPYSLAMMWASLGTLAMLNWPKKRSQLTFILSSIFGLYSSYLYPFFLLCQLAYLTLVKKIKIKKLLAPLGLIVLAFLPWLPKFWQQLTVGQALRLQMPGWAEVVSLPQLKSLPLVPLKFIYGLLDLEPNLFFIASFLLLLVLVTKLFYDQRSNKNTQTALTFALYFFLAPLLLIWVFSFFIPVLQPKRVLFLLPAFFIFISHLIIEAKGRLMVLAKILFFSLFAIHLFALVSYWLQPKLQRENWRSLVEEVELAYGRGKSVAVFSFSAPFAPWVYYSEGWIDAFATQSYYLPAETDLANRLKTLSDYEYVLLFDYLRDLTDPNDQLPKLIQDLGFENIGVLDYPNIGFVRMYSKESVMAYENRLGCQ